jgi:flagellar biosynthesis/type III secretory pathway M-ring protein FliF/YscJ
MGLLAKINAIWQKIGIVQRAMLGAIVLACILTGGLLTKWASTANMQLLYKSLSPEDAAAVCDKLSEQSIRYELRGGGTSIYVPEDQVYRLRLDMAKDGLPNSSKGGYEIFDNQKIGVSPGIEKINKMRALQDEMAKTIQLIDGVESARLHIVEPANAGILSGQGKETTASVVLVLRPGWKLNSSSLAAITHIVSGGVEGLKPNNVIVADSRGGLLTKKGGDNTLIDGASTYQDMKSRIEQQMSEKIQDALEKFLGPGRASILSSVVLDMNSETTVQTKYDKGIPKKETIDGSTLVKEAGTDPQGKPVSPGSQDKTETVTNEYMVPETMTTKTTVPGKVTSWSITAMVDLAKPKPAAGAAGGATPPAAPAPAPAPTAAAGGTTPADLVMSIQDVEQIIKNAIGGDKMLQDATSLTVKNIPVYQPPDSLVAAISDTSYEKLSRYIEIARQSSLGILAVCALLALRIFTRASKKAAAAGPEAAGPNRLDAMSLGLLPSGGENSALAVRRHIAAELKQNPDQVKQLFASWLAEGV